MSYAETLSKKQRNRCARTAVTSALFGGISTQVIDSNALIVLYLAMFGGSDSFTMFSASLTSLSNLILLIPCAAFAARWGLRVTYTLSSAVGFLAFLLIAAAPWTGAFAKYAVICGCFVYALTVPVYSSTWYPLLDNILLPSERSAFFSKMRFIYMLFNALMLFLLGQVLDRSPQLWILQTVFVVAGLGLWGRKFSMDCLPIDPEMKRETPNIKKSLSTCLHNQSLVGFSIYLCFIYLAFSAAMPLAVVYMKTALDLPAGTIVVITSLHQGGKIAGYVLMKQLTARYSMRFMIVGTHVAAFFSVALLLCAVPELPGLTVVLGTAFFLLGVIHALLLCINSVEMLALARPGNKIMAIAFCTTVMSLGQAVGTVLSSFLLGCGALAPAWVFCGLSLSKFQLLFGFYTFAILFFMLLLPLAPAVIREHQDYYNP